MLSSILPGPRRPPRHLPPPRPGSTAAASSSHRPEPSRERRTDLERARPSAFALAQDSAQGTANCGGHSWAQLLRETAAKRRRPSRHFTAASAGAWEERRGRGERPGRHVVRGTGPGKAGREGGGSYGSHSTRGETQVLPPGLCLGQVSRPASAGPVPACITS